MSSSDSNSKGLTITRPALLVNGSDAEFRVLINRLLYFSARLLSVRDGFGTVIGVTGIQYSILMSVKALSEADDVTVNQLADHLNFSGSFVTIEAGKLQARGLLAKERHHLDGRKIILTITKDGRKLLSELIGTQQAINDILFQNLSSQEFKVLRGVVDRLVVNSDEATLELSHLVSKLNAQQAALSA